MCKHEVLYLDDLTEFGASGTCLLCSAAVEVEANNVEKDYVGFESTEPPQWHHRAEVLQRDTLLVARRLLS